MLRAAASAGLKVAPQGTGHGAPPLAGHLSDAVLLRTSAMTELRVDAARRTARVGAGVLWGDVVERAGRVDLAALHTSSPGVGVVGSSLGGGLSWYARQHGLQCSAITAVELVLADGTFVRATDEVDSDLLWAARGGGGGFGVVTALEFDLLPVSTAYAGMLAWDWTHAQRVLTAWGEWAAASPDSVTSVARLFQAPDLPWLPADVRGRKLVIIDAVVLAGSEAATRVLAPLRALRAGDRHVRRVFRSFRRASPARSRSRRRRSTRTAFCSTRCPSEPWRRWWRRPARDRGRTCSSSSCVSSGEQCHGRPRAPERWTAWTARSWSSCVGLDQGAGWAAVREDANRVTEALQPWATGSAYLLMADEDVDEQRGWPASSWQRLVDIRAAADPHGLFLSPHPAAKQS